MVYSLGMRAKRIPMDYPPRIYDLSLQLVGIVVGLLLVAGHLTAFVQPESTKGWLNNFPRSKTLGIVLLLLDAIWTFWLVTNMDLGEFSTFRTYLQIGIPIVTILTIYFVDEFLAVRALGILALLAAEPILSAAFLRTEVSRLLIVILAYVWLTLGLFWVGMPYLLRDQITWLTKSAARFKSAAIAGMVYGVIVLICAVAFFR
jgi:hypothetical protein